VACSLVWKIHLERRLYRKETSGLKMRSEKEIDPK
jgi:hypothetical protein